MPTPFSRLLPRHGRRAPLLALGLLAAGCHYHPTLPAVRMHRVFFNDFEQMAGWLPEPAPSLTTERAHSGRYAIKVDAEHPFSITYHKKLGDLFAMRPRRLHLSAWAWVEDAGDDAQLTLSLGAPNDPAGKSKLYTQAFLVDNWPYKRWTHVSRYIDLPPEVSSQAEISVYLWLNTAAHPVYTDDWELTELH